MRWTLLFLVPLLFSCGHTSSARNEFMLDPGESRTFSFPGLPVHALRVHTETGSVTVFYRYREGGEIREFTGKGREKFLKDKQIVEVVVTARDAATGYLDVRH